MIDVALVQLPAPGMKTTTLMQDELCAILPTASPLARRHQLSIRDLAGEPFIVFRYTSDPLLHAAYARRRLTPRVRCRGTKHIQTKIASWDLPHIESMT